MQETYTYIYNSVSSSNQSSFRIWITTEVHPKFSISLLQISVHFTYEPPEGTHTLFIYIKEYYKTITQIYFIYKLLKNCILINNC